MGATSEKPAWFVLTQHWLSLLGLALLASALISWLFVLPQQVRGHVDNPYVGIVVFLVLSARLPLGRPCRSSYASILLSTFDSDASDFRYEINVLLHKKHSPLEVEASSVHS